MTALTSCLRGEKQLMATTFQGFTQQGLDFLRDLAGNNNREWFAEHKAVYSEALYVPMKQLVLAINPVMEELDPKVSTSPVRTVSRIHRDTRFARDKSPYKTAMWFAYKRPVENWAEIPVYFFEIKAAEYSYGMGFYLASSATMREFRSMIDTNPKAFLATIPFYMRGKTFKLETEDYKRPPDCPHGDEIAPWYRCKTFALICRKTPDKTLFSRKLVDVLINGFVQLKPLYDYLWQAYDRANSP